MLVDDKPQTVFIHIGSNAITIFNHHDAGINYLANMIIEIWLNADIMVLKKLLFGLLLLEIIINIAG